MNINMSVITAFNTVYFLTQSRDRKCLNLRFAYIYLDCVINALNIVAEVTYTNIYLNTKNNSSDISSY